MSFVSKFSKIPEDILVRTDDTLTVEDFPKQLLNEPVRKTKLDAPKRTKQFIDHELLADHSRISKDVEGFVEERRQLGGNASAEHLIRELNAAAQINRGPPGTSNGSCLHWDLLCGKDETIEPCDYLDFEHSSKF
ncbi:hypothetical protein AB6A40_002432 [Gnathostoma spinigerum]|uniref:Uncharacterized protein n=1 Tax=Gnathostoma spinigerum TaxID=75299 RepID=A0ABD6E6Q6_9BILA